MSEFYIGRYSPGQVEWAHLTQTFSKMQLRERKPFLVMSTWKIAGYWDAKGLLASGTAALHTAVLISQDRIERK